MRRIKDSNANRACRTNCKDNRSPHEYSRPKASISSGTSLPRTQVSGGASRSRSNGWSIFPMKKGDELHVGCEALSKHGKCAPGKTECLDCARRNDWSCSI